MEGGKKETAGVLERVYVFTCIVVVIRRVYVCKTSSNYTLKICTLYMYIIYLCTYKNNISPHQKKFLLFLLSQELDFMSISNLFIRRISGSRYDTP